MFLHFMDKKVTKEEVPCAQGNCVGILLNRNLADDNQPIQVTFGVLLKTLSNFFWGKKNNCQT